MSSPIQGPAAAALESLTPKQLEFIKALPKAELHAHLMGCIPISTIQELARDHKLTSSTASSLSSEAVHAGLEKLIQAHGPSLHSLADFFPLFPTIFALTSTPAAVAKATRAVLSTFLDGEHPQCTYLELRSTPRETEAMTREVYVRTILEEAAKYPKEKVGVIVSLDREMGDAVLSECVGIARKLKEEGCRVVGVDLCGNPAAGDVADFESFFAAAKEAGLAITMHIAETAHSSSEETLKLLSYGPDRLGHGTFLDEEAKKIVHEKKIAIEVCLSSNLLCKTISTLEAHHIKYYLKHKHPIAICTDDTLPFRTSLDGEYALLLAQHPLGLGLSEKEVKEAAGMSLAARFK